MAARGFQRIEIASFGAYCFHFNFGSPTPVELKRMLNRLDLQPICLNYDTGIYEAWIPEERTRFVNAWKRKLVQLGEVGIPMMTMDFGVRNDRPDQDRQLGVAVKTYDQVGKMAAKYGVRMLLELPHLYGIMPGTPQVLWMLRRLESNNIGLLIDSSHWGIIGYDLDAFVAEVGDRLWHVHLRDSNGPDTADFKQQLELTPGDGTVDFQKFARTLDRIGYQGDVTLDFEYRDMTLDDIEKEYDKGLRYLEEVGWELPAGVTTGVRARAGLSLPASNSGFRIDHGQISSP